MKNIIIAILLFLPITTHCQNNFGNEWIIGARGYKIKFDSPIAHDTTWYLNGTFFDIANSNICDSNGNIILLSNGMNIYDRNGNYIDQGDTLVPKDWYDFNQGYARYSQSSLFLPMDNKKYYFINTALSDTQLYNSLNIHPWKGSADILMYSAIDMNANGGAGKVIKRMMPIVQNVEMLKVCMQACRHANGKDWWLLKQTGDSANGNRVFKFLFTQDSVYNMGTQSIPHPFRGYNDLYGQMSFSRDGTKWASTYCAYPSTGEVYIADFDRCTGMLSNFDILVVGGQPTGFPVGDIQKDTSNFGLCFSPNGQQLYISRYSHVMQYQFANNAFYKLCGLDTTYNNFAGYTSLGLGNDSKIYIGTFHGTSKQLSVIENPDGQGAGCNFCPKCLRQKSVNWTLRGAPDMPHYELGADLPCWPLSNDEVLEYRDKLEVYPNPASSNIYIKAESKGKRELYNSVGQLLFSTDRNEIDVSKYASGIYYLKVKNAISKVIIE